MRMIRRITINIAGWGLIAFGIIGILLPLIPGLLFVLAGLYLLSLHSSWFHRQLHRFLGRYPAFVSFIERLDARVKRLLHIA